MQGRVDMEKYETANIEVVEFEEDVITASGTNTTNTTGPQ
jgi:hypothetical protein